MADIALVVAGKIEVVESLEQFTAPAAEAIVAGAPVRFDTTSARFTNGNGGTAPEARVYGIATHSVAAGEALTAIKKGVLDGFVLDALAYDARLFVSNTDGRIGDGAGTVSVPIGRVVPGFATTLGTSPDKLMLVDVPYV